MCHRAGFETATSAAAAGGITTMVDMPLNSVPCTISAERLREKLAASTVRAGSCLVHAFPELHTSVHLLKQQLALGFPFSWLRSAKKKLGIAQL